MERNSQYNKARYDLAVAVMNDGAFLTFESNHPHVIERDGPHGRERGFKLKLHEKNPDAPLSPYRLNLRTSDHPKQPGPLTQETVDLAARCMRYIQYSEQLASNVIAGVPWAGEPFAKTLARLSGLSCLELEKYEYGETRCVASIKGDIPLSVRKVLLTDDLVTKADSKREAIQVLRDEGLEVADVIVLIDREQGGREELAEMGCDLHAVFTVTELVELYASEGLLASHLRSRIFSYLAAASREPQERGVTGVGLVPDLALFGPR